MERSPNKALFCYRRCTSLFLTTEARNPVPLQFFRMDFHGPVVAREIVDVLERKISAILVTHDQEEAFAVGDVTGIMLDGHLQQWGPEQELLEKPANDFVSRFLGS